MGRSLRMLLASVVAMTVLAQPAAADDDVWATMRDTPGLVLYMRHATAPGVSDPVGFDVGNCATQRNLSPAGRAEARRLGNRIRRAEIPVAAVFSSRWCRARDTAALLNIGTPRTNTALDSLFRVSNAGGHPKTERTRRIIRAHRDQPGLLVLVGHQANISALTGIAPASGEGVLLRADPVGRIRVIGRVP